MSDLTKWKTISEEELIQIYTTYQRGYYEDDFRNYFKAVEARLKQLNETAIEQGEVIYQEYNPLISYWMDCDKDTYDKATERRVLYTTPQQPQSVADALEEALGICAKIKTPDNFTDAEKHVFEQATTEYWRAIRALIKRNAEGVE